MTKHTGQAETLAQKVERLELQTAKLDRLVYKLWKRVFKTAGKEQTATPQEEACRLVV
jgi:hypothetical protein